MSGIEDLSISAVGDYYRKNGKGPSDVVEQLYERIQALQAQSPIFISLTPLETLKSMCAEAEKMPAASRSPLWGVFYAVKDNIDVTGLSTTATCPAFSYKPTASAPTVQALEHAGALCVGKTNMDQFAAGLNGTRSPYGVPINAVEPSVIPGGSSSGSASAVAAGCVSFALGTDTAGSGRVPAGLQGIVGIKPSVGMMSTAGVVPACATLDCVSVFALNVADGCEVAKVMAAAATCPGDFTVREPCYTDVPTQGIQSFKFAVPDSTLLDFSGPRGDAYNAACKAAFEEATRRVQSIGGELVQVDFAPLCKVAKMLYETSFVAERYAGIRSFLETGMEGGIAGPNIRDVSKDERLLPVTRAIISGAGKFSAADLYKDFRTLQEKKATIAAMLKDVDVLLVPTVMHHYLVKELQEQEGADPPTWPYNAKLGTFTNFVNLLDMCGVSVPSSVITHSEEGQELKLPFGVTLIGRGQRDAAVWEIAKRFESSS